MRMKRKLPEEFAPRLCRWYRENARPLPWRADTAPYHVWLSEIMLQQTRIEAARDYYVRFLEALPTVEALAACSEEKLLKLWEGLGYYSRARNLHKAAQIICEQYGGAFPRDYAGILRLPGVGAYTAGAVGSICFGLPVPAVDGNVLRVIARLLAIREAVDTPQVRREITAALQTVYDTCPSPGILTQAIMELGEVLCLPGTQPDCAPCPLAGLCKAYRGGRQKDYPVLSPKKPRRVESRTVFLIHAEGKLAVRKRPAGGLLGGMWEFPNAEGAMREERASALLACQGYKVDSIAIAKSHKHVFTHVVWHMQAYEVRVREALPSEGLVWATEAELREAYALPTAFRVFL
ncbi:MAG: A/G-specific adenine glycosylase [Clostridiales Family XIII bacterium]|jgi:A/G-specific adenine glycosylase|nr:A/G-specific adenine glycosylase [Clostridiales Family XIII bacterium]